MNDIQAISAQLDENKGGVNTLFAIALARVQSVQLREKKPFDPGKSESYTGFCKFLLIKETNSLMLSELRDGGAPRVLGKRKRL